MKMDPLKPLNSRTKMSCRNDRNSVWKRTLFILFILSGSVPLLGLLSKPAGWMLCLYSIYVLAYCLKTVQWRNAFSSFPVWLAGVGSAVAVGTLTETLAWLQNYGEGFRSQGALFSPNLFQDIVKGWGYYLVLVFAYLVLTKFYFFSAVQSFLVYGFCGMFLEQRGAVAKIAFSRGPMGLLMFAYLFVVHGSIMGLIVLPLEGRRRTALASAESPEQPQNSRGSATLL
jgi:hypothetical protein